MEECFFVHHHHLPLSCEWNEVVVAIRPCLSFMKFLLLIISFLSLSISFFHKPSLRHLQKQGWKRDWNAQTLQSTENVPEIPRAFMHNSQARAKISEANKGKRPWNLGKNQTEETRRKIAETLAKRGAEIKAGKAAALNLTIQEYDRQRKRKNARNQKMAKLAKINVTRIDWKVVMSERMKERWKDPEYRERLCRRNTTVSERTRKKISDYMKEKWKDPVFRAEKGARLKPGSEGRYRAAQKLRERWLQEEEFRSRMLLNLNTNNRSEELRQRISDTVKRLWQDPVYRNKTLTCMSKYYLNYLESRKKNDTYALERQRSQLLQHAKKTICRGGLISIKSMIGQDLWEEERVSIQPLLSLYLSL